MAILKSNFFILFSVFLLTSCANNPSPSISVAPPETWIQQIEQEAINDGVSAPTVHEALDGFVPNPRVVELGQKQPETTITFATYRHNTINQSRINKGADLMRVNADQLALVEARTGIPREIIVALWGIESSYGQNMGSFETVNSLATLAYEGRRTVFFRSELIAALHILDQEHMPSSELKGSWAGAMGQCQFMPSTYLKYAIDADSNGHRDIWGDTNDVLASIANYLAAEGWQQGASWGREVQLTKSISDSEIGLSQSRSLADWASMGITNLDGSPLPQSGLQASLLQPDGADGASFLVYDNIRALMRWNRSTYFVLSVGLLADDIKRN